MQDLANELFELPPMGSFWHDMFLPHPDWLWRRPRPIWPVRGGLGRRARRLQHHPKSSASGLFLGMSLVMVMRNCHQQPWESLRAAPIAEEWVVLPGSAASPRQPEPAH